MDGVSPFNWTYCEPDSQWLTYIVSSNEAWVLITTSNQAEVQRAPFAISVGGKKGRCRHDVPLTDTFLRPTEKEPLSNTIRANIYLTKNENWLSFNYHILIQHHFTAGVSTQTPIQITLKWFQFLTDSKTTLCLHHGKWNRHVGNDINKCSFQFQRTNFVCILVKKKIW